MPIDDYTRTYGITMSNEDARCLITSLFQLYIMKKGTGKLYHHGDEIPYNIINLYVNFISKKDIVIIYDHQMIDYNRLLNFNNINYEKEIKNSIKEIKDEYGDLTIERTCYVFSSLLYKKLKEKHMIVHIRNIQEVGINFEHYFLLATDGNIRYLIDLTYNQFFDTAPKVFTLLSKNGYITVDDEILSNYIESISKSIRKSKKI